MGEDCQMWLLVTHRNMIVSSMLLLAHTHARTHTLMHQDPFPTSHVWDKFNMLDWIFVFLNGQTCLRYEPDERLLQTTVRNCVQFFYLQPKL